jgi:hypothetical protein
MTDSEISLLQVFTAQVFALVLGAIGVGVADWAYRFGHIRVALYSVWVSCSVTVIWLPVRNWTTNVFLGSGMLRQMFVSTLSGLIFLWVYRNLRGHSAVQEVSHDAPVPGPERGRWVILSSSIGSIDQPRRKI